MRLLSEAGYRTLSLAEMVGHLRRREPFPNKFLAITFDDGYQSVYHHAFPVLHRYGFSATVFMAVGKSGKTADSHGLPSMCERSMVRCGEIREMFKGGISPRPHRDAPGLNSRAFRSAGVRSFFVKKIVEDGLSSEVVSCAYPFGRYDDRCRDIVSREFLCAFPIGWDWSGRAAMPTHWSGWIAIACEAKNYLV
jgi:hypothetical protein